MESPRITSRQNPRIKEAVKLRSARQRAKQRRMIIDGVREINRALDAGIHMVEAFVCPDLCDSPQAKEVEVRLDQASTNVAQVTADVFAKLAFGERADGIVAIARTPSRSIAELQLPSHPVIAVLEGLEKPGNVGAIIRTADGAGIDAVIVADPQTDLFNPNTIRASVGTVFSDRVREASIEETMEVIRKWQMPIVATRPDAERLYTEIDFHQGAAIVLGTEASGLSDVWQHEGTFGVRLPMRGIADSLNVSATAAVLFYEAQRQRRTTAN